MTREGPRVSRSRGHARYAEFCVTSIAVAESVAVDVTARKRVRRRARWKLLVQLKK